MIVGQELASWIGSKQRQQQTQARIETVAARWRQGPVHGRFGSVLASLADPDAAAVSAALCHLFADDCWVDTLMASATEGLRHDPFFEPPFPALTSDIHNGVLVYEDPLASIAVGVTRADALAAKKNVPRGRVSVAFTGYVSVLKFVKAGQASLSFWEAPAIGSDFSAAAAGCCRRIGARTVADGEILVCDGRFQSYVIEHARSNMVIVQATVKLDQAPLSVEYDAVTHNYVGCSATDDGASRIQMITTLLRKLGRADAFPVLAECLDHKNFFVRWHVMREMLGLDAVAALPHLERMALADAHAENRAAAAKVLARFPGLQSRKAA